jgi:hypothetical protein
VLLFDHTHADTAYSGVSTTIPGGQPLYVSLGLLEEGREGVRRMADENTKSNTRKIRLGGPTRRERERQVLDALGLVLDMSALSGEEVWNHAMEWTDEEIEAVLEWALSEHTRASGHHDLRVLPRPACIPEEWK